jgi:glycerophosphoryl diester phosphodiesterase
MHSGDRYRSRVTSPGADAWGPHPLLIAHRVGNTPDRIASAVAAGADLIEADVHLYRRRLEVRHTKTMGVLPWLWDRWYLVPAGGPRLQLAELLEALPDGVTLMLDLKGWHPWLGRQVAAAMESAAPGRPYAVAGRAWAMLDAFEELDHVRIIHSVATPREASALSRRLRGHRSDAVCVKLALLSQPRWATHLRALSPSLFTWPVADSAAAGSALEFGAGGLIVDGVDFLGQLARDYRS